jgi:energy-coupling factor transporter ATP-binding protein EcfA2
MRITRIFVEKLFGIFDHEILLNLDDRITIIHAPNGYGKTIILKMLKGLFNSQYAELLTIPYKRFEVEFDDGRRLEVYKELEPLKVNQSSDLVFALYQHHEKTNSLTVKYEYKDLKLNPSTATVRELVPGSLGRTQVYTWAEEESITAIPDGFSYHTSLPFKSEGQGNQWFVKIKEEIYVYFIDSQRLLDLSCDGKLQSHRDVSPNTLQSTVNTYSYELLEEIKKRLAKYASISQSLDRSFPTRLLRQATSDKLTAKDLRNKWDALEKRRNRLVDLGLLEKDEEQNISIQSQEIDESTKKFLAVYIEDIEKKLDVLGDIAAKIDLFRRIINSKFSYKEIVVSREKGFIFRSKYPEGSEHHGSELLTPSSLSSGEQHELILLYELLFKVKGKSLVLIDEPELSLHIGWQVNFLKDLQEISKLADLDLLIATHAPSLIDDRWDLTVELKGVS